MTFENIMEYWSHKR